MAFTLIINPGSSSKKLALYQDGKLVLESYLERLAEGFERCRHQRCPAKSVSSYLKKVLEIV